VVDCVRANQGRKTPQWVQLACREQLKSSIFQPSLFNLAF